MKLKDTLKRPAVVWTGLALILIIGALLVPIEWVRSVNDLVGESDPSADVFSTELAGIDQALAAGEPVQLSDHKLVEIRAHLQTRRLSKAGPMTHDDVVEATKILREFNAQIASQELKGSRDALRNERNRRLAEAFPRLDPAKIDRELTKLRAQLKSAKRSHEEPR
jgi:hypothetical protein